MGVGGEPDRDAYVGLPRRNCGGDIEVAPDFEAVAFYLRSFDF